MKKALNIISSPVTLVSLFSPLALWFFSAMVVLGLPAEAAAHAVSVKIYFSALMLTLGASAAYRIRAHSYTDGLIRIGIGLVLFQGLYLYGFSFSGKTAIGAGEMAREYYEVKSGPFARPPSLPISCLQIKTGTPESAVLSLGGAGQELSKGQAVSLSGYRWQVNKVAQAPLFILQDSKGAEQDAGYIKLDFQDPLNRSFQFPALPHVYYFSLPGTEEETWKLAGGSWKRSSGKTPSAADTDNVPETLHLTVTRGKLVIVNRIVKKEESVALDGYTVRFAQGVPWVELEVTKTPSYFFLSIGLALIAAGMLARFFPRRIS